MPLGVVQVALWVGNHKNIFTGFSTWAAAKLEYLAVKEEVGNSIEARGKLNVGVHVCLWVSLCLWVSAGVRVLVCVCSWAWVLSATL